MLVNDSTPTGQLAMEQIRSMERTRRRHSQRRRRQTYQSVSEALWHAPYAPSPAHATSSLWHSLVRKMALHYLHGAPESML